MRASILHVLIEVANFFCTLAALREPSGDPPDQIAHRPGSQVYRPLPEDRRRRARVQRRPGDRQQPQLSIGRFREHGVPPACGDHRELLAEVRVHQQRHPGGFVDGG